MKPVKVAPEHIDSRRGIDHIGVSVAAVIHDGHGKILLMKRGEKARDEQGRWDICGGALEFGETITDALHREVKEELCTKIIEVEFLAAYDAHREHQGNKTHWICLLHAARVDPSKLKIGEPHKIAELGWFGRHNLPEPLHSMFSKALLAAEQAGIVK